MPKFVCIQLTFLILHTKKRIFQLLALPKKNVCPAGRSRNIQSRARVKVHWYVWILHPTFFSLAQTKTNPHKTSPPPPSVGPSSLSLTNTLPTHLTSSRPLPPCTSPASTCTLVPGTMDGKPVGTIPSPETGLLSNSAFHPAASMHSKSILHFSTGTMPPLPLLKGQPSLLQKR